VKVVVPKPESVKRLIHDAIAANILFKACSSEELTELVEVFAPSEASAGSTIIRQGDEGDAFYVMERGTVDVYEGDTHKATLYSGTSFGEIALLYGCPRSATLRTRYFCKLWSISRSAFRAITSQFKQRRMEAKVKFLKKVILQHGIQYHFKAFHSSPFLCCSQVKIKDKFLSDVLSESEINTLALATLNESYEAGHIIVREGEPGDIFYMIDSGSVDVFIKAKGDAPVVTLTSGQFFGELALLSNDVRTASCVAKTDVKCHILMRNDFNLLLGDLQSLMDGGDYRRREEEFVQPKKASKVSLQ
jgi:CRP-like cAMP-binding protein